MLNLNVKVGYLKKIPVKEDAKRKMFSLSVKRDYKNADGKYDFDHFTFFYYASDKGPAAYIDKYVTDGDLVSVKGHDSSYQTESDGKKVYHEDKVCDEICILTHGKKDDEGQNEKVPESEEAVRDEGYTLVDDEDLPF